MPKSKWLVAAALVTGIGIAVADDQPPLDVTITVVESPADLPAAVTTTIPLPPSAAARAHERGQPGLDTADQAHTLGRTFGQNIADEAKTKSKGKGRP